VRLQCIEVRYGEETRIEVSHRVWNHAEIDAVRYRDPSKREQRSRFALLGTEPKSAKDVLPHKFAMT
jgi:hypothetical protein